MTEQEKKALDDMPGAAIDYSDDEQTSRKRVKKETRTLNDNPRDTDLAMPSPASDIPE